MAFKYTKNLPQSTLSSGYTAGNTTITVQTGDGAKFDAPGGGNAIVLAIGNPPQFFLKATAVSTDTFTVDASGFDGSTPVSVTANTAVTQVISAGVLASLLNGAFTGAAPLSIVQEATYTSGGSNVSSLTVTFPQALAASGNTAFMLLSCDGSSTVTIPAGWTSDFNVQQNTYARLILCHKTSASDTSATFTVSTASSFAVLFFELVGSRALDQSSTGGSANTSPLLLPSITPSVGAMVIGAVALVQNTSSYWGDALTASLNPLWQALNVMTPFNAGGRILCAHMRRQAAQGGSVTPPAASFPNFPFFASGGMAYATFSII